ncbi:MAG: serine hydrolase domain-containing protein [Nitrospiraceae bacterium]
MKPSDAIDRAMQSAVRHGVFPGAVLLIRVDGHVVFHSAFGSASLVPEREPASLGTVYDLASLTKPLATTSAILCLVQDGRLQLEDAIETHLESLRGWAIGAATIRHLLAHSSGLPAWRPIYERIDEEGRTRAGYFGSEAAKRLTLECIREESLLFPMGARSLYSDLGFILLGLLVERVTGDTIATYCRSRIYTPLGVDSLYFFDTTGVAVGGPNGQSPDLHQVAPTEDDPWRGRILRAEVHDENAYALGGVCGHAGLFGTASAVLEVSGRWLKSYLDQDGFFPSKLVRQFVTRQAGISGSSWGLGWDTPSAPSSTGTRFSPNSFGHLGYTGTSLWIDPLSKLEVVLLSNRVHPSRRCNDIQGFRPEIHDLICQEFLPRPHNV